MRVAIVTLLATLFLTTACAAGAGESSAPAGSPGATGSGHVTKTPLPTGDGALVPDDLDVKLGDASATPTRPVKALPRTFGADISWPQCPRGLGIAKKRTLGAPMPTSAAEFLVVGLTNGPSFTPNPCLVDQVDWARDRNLMISAYAVVSRPNNRTLARLGDKGPYDGSDRLGALSNVGYQAALFTIEELDKAKLDTPMVWVDVEPVPDYDWGSDVTANAAVITGTVRAYRDRGYRVGFYSTPALWERVVGDLRVGGVEWRAAGETSMREALSRCAPDWSFQGGQAVMGQWIEANRDRNVICPRVRLRWADLFTR